MMDGILSNDEFFNRGDDELLIDMIHRIDSTEICYRKCEYKRVGEYVMGDKLGEGSYGKVKECLHSETLRRAAVKIIKQKELRRIPNGEQNVRREIKLLRGMNHTNVISLYDVYYNNSKGKIYMVMDYCIIGLHEMLENMAPEKKLPLYQAHRYFQNLLNGLEYLHSKGVIHKDIKPGNLLLTADSVLKISDFGVAEQVDIVNGDDTICNYQSSPMIQPPEVASGSHTVAGFKVDIWSAGCTLFRMTSGKYPYDGDNVYHLYSNICEQPVVIPEELSDSDLCNLLEGILQKDPDCRMTLHCIKKHRWCMKSHPKTDEEEVMMPVRNIQNILPYLRSNYNRGKIQSTENFITEHQINESLATEAKLLPSSLPDNLDCPGKQKRRKPISCINIKSISSCKQS